MPFELDRRGFLIASLSFFGATLLHAAEDSIHVALLSDTHISADQNDTFRGFFPHANLKQTCAMVSSVKPDLVVVNGDLARSTGQLADYSAFNSFIDPLLDRMPMIVTLGNHDERDNARKSLAKLSGDRQPVAQKLVSVLDAGPCVFVMLDSLLVTAQTQGLLGKAQRDWLAAYLGEPAKKPIIIFVHHNPDGDSDIGLMDADRFLAIAQAHPAVKAIFFGHTHVYSLRKAGAVQLINLPAVGYNFADGNPVGWTEATFDKSGVELTLHAIAGDRSQDGQVSRLEWAKA